mmetsp:Transcript_10205/g.62254  ORF Transcript_10205/g.62254 Transcript_10205/m.62254 type:complete len:460 (+) Transcript_10205:163-1542(+)
MHRVGEHEDGRMDIDVMVARRSENWTYDGRRRTNIDLQGDTFKDGSEHTSLASDETRQTDRKLERSIESDTVQHTGSDTFAKTRMARDRRTGASTELDGATSWSRRRRSHVFPRVARRTCVQFQVHFRRATSLTTRLFPLASQTTRTLVRGHVFVRASVARRDVSFHGTSVRVAFVPGRRRCTRPRRRRRTTSCRSTCPVQARALRRRASGDGVGERKEAQALGRVRRGCVDDGRQGGESRGVEGEDRGALATHPSQRSEGDRAGERRREGDVGDQGEGSARGGTRRSSEAGRRELGTIRRARLGKETKVGTGVRRSREVPTTSAQRKVESQIWRRSGQKNASERDARRQVRSQTRERERRSKHARRGMVGRTAPDERDLRGRGRRQVQPRGGENQRLCGTSRAHRTTSRSSTTTSTTTQVDQERNEEAQNTKKTSQGKRKTSADCARIARTSQTKSQN